jgi:hypothetical protein
VRLFHKNSNDLKNCPHLRVELRVFRIDLPATKKARQAAGIWSSRKMELIQGREAHR